MPRNSKHPIIFETYQYDPSPEKPFSETRVHSDVKRVGIAEQTVREALRGLFDVWIIGMDLRHLQ